MNIQNNELFHIERQIADEIMATVYKLQLPFKLDQLTEGLGNCFPIAIIQQMRRPEILDQLRLAPRRILRKASSHSLLRQAVHQFIMKSKSPRVMMLRLQYEETDGLVNGETWENKLWLKLCQAHVKVQIVFVSNQP